MFVDYEGLACRFMSVFRNGQATSRLDAAVLALRVVLGEVISSLRKHGTSLEFAYGHSHTDLYKAIQQEGDNEGRKN